MNIENYGGMKISPVRGRGPIIYWLSAVIDEPEGKIRVDESEIQCFWCGVRTAGEIADKYNLKEEPRDEEYVMMFVYTSGPPLRCSTCQREILPMEEPMDRGLTLTGGGAE